MGYDYLVQSDEDGSQEGYCLMPDGEVCSQWDFYGGHCGGAFSYCEQNGYTLAARADGQDPFSPSYSVCLDSQDRAVLTLPALLESVESCETDLTEESEAREGSTITAGETRAPSSIDWRNIDGTNWITSVKNQSSCGSCWAFAAVGTAEGSLNILADDPTLDWNLAEEQLVAVCPSVGNCGSCDGGIHTCALSRIRDYGIVDEPCMPYTASAGDDSNCDRLCADAASRTVTLPNALTAYYQSAVELKEYVSRHGPVAVSMGINSDYGGYWDGDIYRCSDDGGTNHAVVVVGYNDEDSYWIVKNSWGSSWGKSGDGYFKVGYGECRIDSSRFSFVDSQAPITDHSLSGTMGGDGWYVSEVTVTLTASDAYGAGVSTLVYAVDGAEMVQVTGSQVEFAVADDGEHAVQYYAIDRGGNRSQIREVTFKQDLTPPPLPSKVEESVCLDEDCTAPFFSWKPTNDDTSGFVGYGLYFGSDLQGTSDIFTTELNYSPPAAEDVWWVFRMRTLDFAGNWSNWQTMFYSYAYIKSYIPLMFR